MPNSRAVVLVGPMGVGKTTIGKKLAKKLEIPFLDTDVIFTKSNGEISDFFEKYGEPAFRELEEEIVLGVLNTPAVIATGGGAVLSEHTRAALGQATVIYLCTDGKHMASRLSGGNRPLLKDGLHDWRKIYESRRSLYEQVADITIDTSKTPLKAIVDEIVERLKSN